MMMIPPSAPRCAPTQAAWASVVTIVCRNGCGKFSTTSSSTGSVAPARARQAELGLGQALAGGSEYRLHAVVYAQANVGGTRRTLAENGARAVAQAGAALGAAAVDPEK